MLLTMMLALCSNEHRVLCTCLVCNTQQNHSRSPHPAASQAARCRLWLLSVKHTHQPQPQSSPVILNYRKLPGGLLEEQGHTLSWDSIQ